MFHAVTLYGTKAIAIGGVRGAFPHTPRSAPGNPQLFQWVSPAPRPRRRGAVGPATDARRATSAGRAATNAAMSAAFVAQVGGPAARRHGCDRLSQGVGGSVHRMKAPLRKVHQPCWRQTDGPPLPLHPEQRPGLPPTQRHPLGANRSSYSRRVRGLRQQVQGLREVQAVGLHPAQGQLTASNPPHTASRPSG